MNNHVFKIGDKVHIGNRLDLGIGTVVGLNGAQVDIFFRESGVAEVAHVSDVELALGPLDLAKEGIFDDPIRFELRMAAARLPMANIHGILSNAIIEILPHQILAAHRVLTSETRRMLLADEVGLGKTFEAGIIVRELISRDEARRVLIITPASLTPQWQEDMAKFGLDFTIYQSGLEESIRDLWDKINLVITSIDTIKIEENLNFALSCADWDMIIFDEAHHLTRKDYGTKADKSDRYRVGEKLSDRTKYLLFLTATPHQGDRNKFYNLINLLDNKLFKDEYDLFRNRAKLGQIMVRQRKIDVTDEEGKPLFVKRIVSALRYTPSDEEALFFRKLDHYLMTGYRKAEQGAGKHYRALGFVMITFQKIAASSINAVKSSLLYRLVRLLFIEFEKCNDKQSAARIKAEIIRAARRKYDVKTHEDEIYLSERAAFDKYLREEGVDPFEFVAAPDEIESLHELLSYVPVQEDTKLRELVSNIKAIRSSNPEDKFIIFTEYLATQDYIVSKLRHIYGSDNVVFIRGGDHHEKALAARAFKNKANFLVSTQAGGEGINLQHCHILINYDMPWNPMKVEQRIGRVHRYKQKDTVQIYNIFAKDTIEDRIYDRLESKLEEITQTIGNDDEREAFRENILGIIAEEIDFESLYKAVLQKGAIQVSITQTMIDEALQRAKEIYEKLGDLTQDLERFSLDQYVKNKGEYSLKDIERFILKFVHSEGKRVIQNDDSSYEFIVPECIPSYGGLKQKRITFERESAIEDQSLQFMALGNPIVDAMIKKCVGHGYGGKSVKRIINSTDHRGQTGAQVNFVVEYQVPPSSNRGSSKSLRKDFRILMFDGEGNCMDYPDQFGTAESDRRKPKDGEFSFVTSEYASKIETEAQKRISEVINADLEQLRDKYPNVTFKSNIDAVAFFVVK